MDEVQGLADELKCRYCHVPSTKHAPIWNYPALMVLDCVLSLNRRYNSFVVPRVEKFAKSHPEVRELGHLLDVIDRYGSPVEFCILELNYRDENRANTLRGVIEYLIVQQATCQGSTELERLGNWASSLTPKDYQSVSINGLGLAGFQYLRMLFGVQTVKPDRHIKQFVAEVIGRPVSDMNALLLLEKAAELAQLPLQEVDAVIWRERSDYARNHTIHSIPYARAPATEHQPDIMTRNNGESREVRIDMATLVIHAPRSTVVSKHAKSFEKTYKDGLGEGYAIYRSIVHEVHPGCTVVLLSKDQELRAEGKLVKLVATTKTDNGCQRYDVHIEGLKKVPYKPEKLNHCGVALIK